VSISEGENPGSIVSFLPVAEIAPPTLHQISPTRNMAMASNDEQSGCSRLTPVHDHSRRLLTPPPYIAVLPERAGALARYLLPGRACPASASMTAVRRGPAAIHVLPFSAGAHPAMDGPFCLSSFPEPEDPTWSTWHEATSGLVPEEPEEVRRYTLMFGTLLGKALSAEKSVTFMSAITQNQT
jgi:hypothetical protein